MHFHFVSGHVESDIRHMQEVNGEILFDGVALVTATNDEVIHSMGWVFLDDVPQNGPTTNFNHGLGLRWVSLEMRVPSPPARMTAFIKFYSTLTFT
jgi:hypothetical protein